LTAVAAHRIDADKDECRRLSPGVDPEHAAIGVAVMGNAAVCGNIAAFVKDCISWNSDECLDEVGS